MQKMRLSIITIQDFSCCDLYTNSKSLVSKNNLPITIDKIYVEDIIISYNDSGITLQTNDFDLIQDFDAFLFRIDLQKDLNKVYCIAKALKDAKKILVNETFSNYTTFSDKVSVLNVLQELRLNHPKTIFTNSKKILSEYIETFGFPFILKDPNGWQGSSVYLIKTQKEFEKTIKQMPPSGFIMQEYLQIDHDVRIIVIGYKALGAMKRINPKDDFRSNLSVGGTAEQIELSSELRNISQKIATHIGSAMLGVDFFVHNNKIYVVEIETCPGFNGFAKCTNTNPTLILLQYLYDQYKKTI